MTKRNQKNKTKNRFTSLRIGKALLMLGVILTISLSASAQPESEDPDSPLDGGISLVALAGAGIAYGANKWRKSRKENENQSEGTEVEG